MNQFLRVFLDFIVFLFLRVMRFPFGVHGRHLGHPDGLPAFGFSSFSFSMHGRQGGHVLDLLKLPVLDIYILPLAFILYPAGKFPKVCNLLVSIFCIFILTYFLVSAIPTIKIF